MGRRSANKVGGLLALVVFFGTIWFVQAFVTKELVIGLLLLAVVIVVGRSVAGWVTRARRKSDFVQRYGQEIADRLLRREVWIGQTEQQLVEACGAPAAYDESATAEHYTRVYKYQPSGKNRYRVRVTVVDGVVSRWDSR